MAQPGEPLRSVPHRTKVYKLNSAGLWDDKGTGLISLEYMEVRKGRPAPRSSSVD